MFSYCWSYNNLIKNKIFVLEFWDVTGFAYIKVFIDNYNDCLAMKDIKLAMVVNRSSKVPHSMLKGQGSLKDYEDGEIVHKCLGVVFVGKNKNNQITNFLFQVCDVERCTNSQYTIWFVLGIARRILLKTKITFERLSFGILRFLEYFTRL